MEDKNIKRREYYKQYKNKIKVIKAEVKPEIRTKLDEIIRTKKITIVQWIIDKIEEDYYNL